MADRYGVCVECGEPIEATSARGRLPKRHPGKCQTAGETKRKRRQRASDVEREIERTGQAFAREVETYPADHPTRRTLESLRERQRQREARAALRRAVEPYARPDGATLDGRDDGIGTDQDARRAGDTDEEDQEATLLGGGGFGVESPAEVRSRDDALRRLDRAAVLVFGEDAVADPEADAEARAWLQEHGYPTEVRISASWLLREAEKRLQERAARDESPPSH